MTGTIHIVGAGLAGLSCAVRLADEGRRVALHEAARMAGGRCRSYFDATLDLTIDNGNHLLLSGNTAARDYGARIGASDALVGPAECEFDFLDCGNGQRLAAAAQRLENPLVDLRTPIAACRARDRSTISTRRSCSSRRTARPSARPCAATALLYEKLWRPVLLSALNTEPKEASATLAGAVLRETLAAGGDACRPLVAQGRPRPRLHRAGADSNCTRKASRRASARGCVKSFSRAIACARFASATRTVTLAEDDRRRARRPAVERRTNFVPGLDGA